MLKRTVLIVIFFISFNAFAKDVSKKYGLVFIYDTKCPYCQKMAPTVVDIHKEYGLGLYAISPSRQVFGIMEHETNGQVSLNKDIAQKYYGSNPVRFPLLILQELDGEMKHYVIADGLTPKNQVEQVLNSYLNYFESTKKSIETERQEDNLSVGVDGKKLTQKQKKIISKSFKQLGSIGVDSCAFTPNQHLVESLGDNTMKQLTQEQIDKLNKSLKRIKHYGLESGINMSKEQWNKVLGAMKDANKSLAKLEREFIKSADNTAQKTSKIVKLGDTND